MCYQTKPIQASVVQISRKKVIIQFWHPNSILYFSFYFGTLQSPAGPMMTALRASGFLQHQISHLLLDKQSGREGIIVTLFLVSDIGLMSFEDN